LIKFENNTKYLIVYLSPRFIVNNYQFIYDELINIANVYTASVVEENIWRKGTTN